METIHNVNVFKTYKQEENSFTNGLFSLLRLSIHEKPGFIKTFVKNLLSLDMTGNIGVKVLQDITFADAELICNGHCIRFETKIWSGALTHKEIRRRIKELNNCPGKIKRVVLLTPDDGESNYITEFLDEYKPRLLHLGWKNVYDYLETTFKNSKRSVFSEIVRQFLDRIREYVFDQDFAGIIQKVAFTKKSGVNHKTWLQDLMEWPNWCTPQKYEKLDGKGRKLLLYDGKNKEIPIEVEIQKVKKTQSHGYYPWTNYFAPDTIKIYKRPIQLKDILKIPGFENFTRSWTSHWNITREQYRRLTEKTN